MLLAQSSFFCPPIKFPLSKCPKTNVLFANHLEKKPCSGKNVVLHKGNSYFTCRKHHQELELPKLDNTAATTEDLHARIGILKFFEGKNIFVTGATGLLGKVLVEKILRSTPVRKVYLLIKPKDKNAAFDRLTEEIINSDLFKCLKEEHGNSYEAFVREKLIPVIGNICEPNLGMSYDSADAVRKDVDVIIQCAACTSLNERYDLLFDANVNAPQRLMRFAKTCKNLKLFAHFSTAYVNGSREGIILEKPLIMGDNGRKEGDELPTSFPHLDVADEINMILKSSVASTGHDVAKNLKKLGQERAALFGWNDAYQLTKAMGEMVLNEIRGDVTLLIVRPAIIESSYKEPFPGWIQGNRMFDPIVISYGKGQLPAYFANPEVALDLIPVDMVANTSIAAIAKHGSIHKPQLDIYHVASSVTNPLTFSDAFEYMYEHFNTTPLIQSQNIKRVKFFNNFNDFSKYTREEISRQNRPRHAIEQDEKMIRKIQNQCNARVAYAEQLCKMYEFAGFFNARFHTGNTQQLIEEMSKEEKLIFEVDARSIDWKKYFQEIHIPGVKKYIINSSSTTSARVVHKMI